MQWLLAIVGAGLSGAVIVLTLLPVLKANAAKESINLWIQQKLKFEIAMECKKYHFLQVYPGGLALTLDFRASMVVTYALNRVLVPNHQGHPVDYFGDNFSLTLFQ